MHLTSRLVFARLSAHCAYRRGERLRRPLNGAPSALLNGAPSARRSYPESYSSSRNNYLIPNYNSCPDLIILSGTPQRGANLGDGSGRDEPGKEILFNCSAYLLEGYSSRLADLRAFAPIPRSWPPRIPNRLSHPETMTCSRNGYLVPKP